LFACRLPLVAQHCLPLQAQFTEYRAAQRDTPEAQLQLQLQEATAAAARAEDRAARAIKLKKQYKQQVQARSGFEKRFLTPGRFCNALVFTC
jgi:hypothetical protein